MGRIELDSDEWAWGELTDHHIIIERLPPINDPSLPLKEPRVTYAMTAFDKSEDDVVRWKENNIVFLGTVTDNKTSEKILKDFKGLLYYPDYVRLRKSFKINKVKP